MQSLISQFFNAPHHHGLWHESTAELYSSSPSGFVDFLHHLASQLHLRLQELDQERTTSLPSKSTPPAEHQAQVTSPSNPQLDGALSSPPVNSPTSLNPSRDIPTRPRRVKLIYSAAARERDLINEAMHEISRRCVELAYAKAAGCTPLLMAVHTGRQSSGSWCRFHFDYCQPSLPPKVRVRIVYSEEARARDAMEEENERWNRMVRAREMYGTA